MTPHLSQAQADFMQLQRASRFAPCAGTGGGSVFVYREEPIGTCRWHQANASTPVSRTDSNHRRAASTGSTA